MPLKNGDKDIMIKTICLASNSPRRRELIKHLNRPFTTFSVDIEETSSSKEPAQFVREVAGEKADAVLETRDIGEEEAVITADTCVSVGGEILGKPRDRAEGFEMLRKLSGRTHKVATGVVVLAKKDGQVKRYCLCEVTDVTVAELSDDEIDAYLDVGEYADKAGAYAIQGVFSRHITGINGDYNNVVGFPVAAVYELLKKIDT